MRARSGRLIPVGGGEGRHESLDVVFVVVEVDREPQVAVPRRADDSLPGQDAEKLRWFPGAERDADDRAAVVFGQVDRVPAGAGERDPQLGGELVVAGVDGAGPESSKMVRAAWLPISASQLMELSKRDAVADRFIKGPKKLSNGTLPALQPALTGVNRA